MFLLFVLIFGSIVLFAARQSSTTASAQCEKQHKWVLRNNETDDKKCYLVCKVCGKIPGEE